MIAVHVVCAMIDTYVALGVGEEGGFRTIGKWGARGFLRPPLPGSILPVVAYTYMTLHTLIFINKLLYMSNYTNKSCTFTYRYKSAIVQS